MTRAGHSRRVAYILPTKFASSDQPVLQSEIVSCHLSAHTNRESSLAKVTTNQLRLLRQQAKRHEPCTRLPPWQLLTSTRVTENVAWLMTLACTLRRVRLSGSWVPTAPARPQRST